MSSEEQQQQPKLPNLGNVELLKRFIYTGDYNGQFITGNNSKFLDKCNHQAIFDWIKQSHKEFIEEILKINNDNLLVQRQNIHYLLSIILITDYIEDENIKKDIRDIVLKCCKTDEEFFDFIQYFTTLKRGNNKRPKLSKRLRNIVEEFYHKKTPIEFAKCISRYHSLHGWHHKDLIKLSHFNSENLLITKIIKYILFGFDHIKDDDSPEFKDILNHLRLSNELRTTNDINRAIDLIKDLHATIGQINSKFNRNANIWSVLLSEMPLKDILQSLMKFYRLGWLKPNNAVYNTILSCLTDENRVKNSNIHPIEVFLYMKIFEKGGKRRDPQFVAYLKKNEDDLGKERVKRILTPIEPKCPPLFHNLNKCLFLSYKNVRRTDKRFFITLDIIKGNTFCFHNRSIPAIEAAYGIIRFFQKAENYVTLAVFCDDRINLVDLSKCYSANDSIQRLQQFKSTYILPQAPFEFAINKKKQIDVFINIQNSSSLALIPKELKDKLPTPSEILNKYCTKMNRPNTKFVRICLTSHKVLPFDDSKNILNIAGFTEDIPRTLEAFYNGNFV